jgi:hypothetical protein
MKRGAIISDCGKYRYQLWRVWNDKLPLAFFIMLNPSKADADQDDPTIRRLIGFAKRMGCGGFYVGNMFPYRATNPKELKSVGFEVAAKELNWFHLSDMRSKCQITVLAWGNPPIQKTNIHTTFLGDEYCFGCTNKGNPKHPLFLHSETPLTLYFPK